MNERYEKVIQRLQQQLGQQAANYGTQIAVLQTDLEDAQERIAELEAQVPQDTEEKDTDQ